MEYSQMILNYIESKAITGYRLAKETGISESLFGKWRKNPTSKIDALTLTKIADYLGVSTDYLLGKTDIKKAPSIEEERELTDEEWEIIQMYRNASADTQKAVNRIVGAE